MSLSATRRRNGVSCSGEEITPSRLRRALVARCNREWSAMKRVPTLGGPLAPLLRELSAKGIRRRQSAATATIRLHAAGRRLRRTPGPETRLAPPDAGASPRDRACSIFRSRSPHRSVSVGQLAQHPVVGELPGRSCAFGHRNERILTIKNARLDGTGGFVR